MSSELPPFKLSNIQVRYQESREITPNPPQLVPVGVKAATISCTSCGATWKATPGSKGWAVSRGRGGAIYFLPRMSGAGVSANAVFALTVPVRMWLRRAELNAMLTRELQKIAGCAGSTLIAGAQIPVADFEQSNWADFAVTPAPGSDENLVRAVAGGVVSAMREVYNVVD